MVHQGAISYIMYQASRFEKNPGFEKNKIKQSKNCLDFHLFSSKVHLDDDVMYY